jgi:nucleotide-binding universal stress UspA family protein
LAQPQQLIFAALGDKQEHPMEQRGLFARAIQDFRYARSQAALEKLAARLMRRSATLLSFEEVRQKLHLPPTGTLFVENIPLDAIIGSVGRYSDFTRSYWPLADSDEQRWAKVKLAVSDLKGVPPIEVYQVGEAYFVKDGNHRVSVFREMGATQIQAIVTKIPTRVQVTSEDDIDDIIIKAEHLKFLESTRLDRLRPESDIRLSVPGAYQDIQEHMQIYQRYLSLQEGRAVTFDEAVVAWYDHYYSVVVHNIRSLGILRDFPNQTEGDIYMRVWEHRGKLMEKTQIAVSVDLATRDLAAQKGESVESVFSRFFTNVIKPLLPEMFLPGPAPGKWRELMTSMKHRKDCLFGYVLVSMGSDQNRRKGLEQALIIAKKERSTLYGLHVIPPGIAAETRVVSQVRELFEERCAQEGVEGYFSLGRGKISRQIIERSRWTDLVVTTLSHPPGKKRLGRFRGGFDVLVRTCATPILAVPQSPSQCQRALVAYDGSPKAREALFIAVYMAHRWHTELVVMWVPEAGKLDERELQDMYSYLDRNELKPTLVEGQGSVPQAIVTTATGQGCDLILIGGYSRAPVFEVLLGSAVDEVLRTSRIPILVCR